MNRSVQTWVCLKASKWVLMMEPSLDESMGPVTGEPVVGTAAGPVAGIECPATSSKKCSIQQTDIKAGRLLVSSRVDDNAVQQGIRYDVEGFARTVLSFSSTVPSHELNLADYFSSSKKETLGNMFGGEGAPLVKDPSFDILLGDVKNERGENEAGIVTLGEIATEMGFENRGVLASESTVTSPLGGIVRGRYKRSFLPIVITSRRKSIKTVFLIDTVGTATFVGKPTWDKLMEGVEDTGRTTIVVKLNGTRQEVTLSPQHSHFPDIDLIGTDFLSFMKARFTVDYGTETCQLEWTEDEDL